MADLALPTDRAAEVALADLRRAVIGPVHGPGDVAVITELAGFNLALEHRPVAVVGATGAGDVAAAVRWAAARGIGVGVVATGHSDISQRGTLVISTRRMDRVRIDPVARRAVVGAGVRWARVVEAAAPYGLAGLNGSSGGVGVVGYTLGGGLGPFARRYGYAADLVRRLQVVTGDGVIREVTADSDHELFNALLGGKDVAGVVTELEFELAEIPRLYGGGLVYDAADTATVLHAWRRWAPSLPEDMTTSVAILRVPDDDAAPPLLRGRTVVHLRVAHLGSEESGRELLAPMRAVAAPLLDMVGEMPYAAVDAIHMEPTTPMPGVSTARYLADVDAGAVDTLLAVAGPHQDIPVVVVELRHVDGAAARGRAGCMAREGARFVLAVVAARPPALRDVAPVVAQGVVDALAPWGTGHAPINWVAPETDAGTPWADGDRVRVAAVSRRVDPAGILGGARAGLTG